MQIVFIGDNFHEMSNPVLKIKYTDKYMVIVFFSP